MAKVTIDAKSTAELRANKAEIETVIVNLLSNAIRYTPEDGSITMTWQSDDEGADLIVTDTGEGIDPEYIPRLTERFFRVDKARSREMGGTGLGLSIVKHLSQAFGGSVTLHSKVGAGSSFRVSLPAA